MKIRLVAIDLDGTLLNSAKEITATTATIIRAAREVAHVKVVLATARPPRTVLPFYSLLGLDTPMINYNGALVHEPHTGRIVLHRPMEAKIAREVAAMGREMFPDILVSAEVLDNWYTDRVEDGWRSETQRLSESYTVAPLGQWMNQPITRLHLLGRRQWLTDIRHAIAARMPRQIAIAWSESSMLQIMNPTAGKRAALRTVAAEMGLDASEVMAIGDNANDAGMLQWAGIGVAMANASPKARSVADYVTDANDADGAAKAIAKLIVGPATHDIDVPDLSSLEGADGSGI
jgi:5-amino-6-(5-phospho-D-ribitylamino)uracil phosphatase